MTLPAQEEMLIAFSDLKRLFQKQKKKLFRLFLGFGISILCFLLLQETKYSATATFRQSFDKSDAASGVRGFLKHVGIQEDDARALAVMQSQRLVGLVAQEMGLQVRTTHRSFFANLALRIYKNVASEFGIVLPHREEFIFSKVLYKGEKPLSLFFRFVTPEKYQVLNRKKEVVAEATIHKEVVLKNASFILDALPKRISLNKIYPLKISPFPQTVEKLLKRLKVKASKIDKKLLHLSFVYPNRHRAAEFLNSLMAAYEQYLQEENEDLSKIEAAYLEKRQDELTQKMDAVLQEQVAYMKKNLGENGFIGLSQEIEMLALPKEQYISQLLDMDLELKRFEKTKREKRASSMKCPEKKQGSNIKKSTEWKKATVEEKISLKHEKKKKKKPLQRMPYETQQEQFQKRLLTTEAEERQIASTLPYPKNAFKELEILLQSKEEAILLLAQLEKGEPLFDAPTLTADSKNLLSKWIRQIKESSCALQCADDSQKEKSQEVLDLQRFQFTNYLHDYLRGLEERKRGLEENLLLKGSPSDLEGISLESAQALYMEYNQQLDAIQGTIRQLLFFCDQIDEPEFEISSLSNLLSDSVSQQMIERASQWALQLSDQDNRSLRELERIRSALSSQKAFLRQHLNQTIELQKLKLKLVEEKMTLLQETSIDLLKKEKGLIEEKLAELCQRMSGLPEKWRLENQLKWKKELSMSIIEGLTQLAESKIVSRRLFQVESKPLDFALPPVAPQYPFLLFYSLLGAFLGALLFYGVALCKGIARGLPMTQESLKAHRQNSCGSLSPFCDSPLAEMPSEDLETLRKVSSFLTLQRDSSRGACAVLFGGELPDYSHALAHLLGMQGVRSLLIHSVFDGIVSQDHVPGLWHYLSEDIPFSPRKHPFYDFVPTGGTTRHASELLSQTKLSSLLEEAKKQYDIVLIYSTCSLKSTEAELFLKRADLIVATLSEESWEDLLSYRLWKEQKGKECFTCVLSKTV